MVEYEGVCPVFSKNILKIMQEENRRKEARIREIVREEIELYFQVARSE